MDTFAAVLMTAHLTADLHVLPVFDESFVFPGQPFWDDLNTLDVFGSSNKLIQIQNEHVTMFACREEVVLAYKWLFNSIATRFSARGSQRVQDVEIQEIV